MKKCLCLILALVICMSLLPISVLAADIASGSGWRIDSAGTLHLTGKITNLSDQYDNYTPWRSHAEKITKIVAEKGSSVSNGRFLFMGCKNLVSADLSLLSCQTMTDAYRMFSGCESLTSFNLNTDLSQLTEITCMFYECSSLKSIDLSFLSDSPITDTAILFGGCSSLTTIDFTPLKGAKLTDLGGLFQYCSSLTTVDFSPLNTENVTDMAYMFRKCTSLKEIDLSCFNNNPNLHSIQGMFEDCSSLEKANLENFDTAHVKYMLNLFSGCSSLKDLNLKGFSTASAVEAYWMFKDCASLKTLDLSGFDTRKMVRMENLIEGCTSLEEYDVSTFKFEDDIHYGVDEFTGCDSLKKIKISIPYLRLIADELIKYSPAWTNAETGDVYRSRQDLISIAFAPTLIKGENLRIGKGWKLDNGTLRITGAVSYEKGSTPPWYYYREEIREVITENGASVDNCKNLFAGCINLKSADLSKLDTLKATDMSHMFSECEILEKIDLSNLNTVSVTDMQGMFEDCFELKFIDVSNFSVKEDASLSGMFSGCTSLNYLKTNSTVLFHTSKALISLTSAWYNAETSEKYTGAWELFDISGKVTLVTITSSGDGWYIDSSDCLHLTGAVTNATSATSGDKTPWASFKKQIVKVVSEAGASVDNCRKLFAGCPNLICADLSKLNTAKVRDMTDMFANCPELSYVNFGSVNVANVTQTANVFSRDGNDSLAKITASGAVLAKLSDSIFNVYYQWEDRLNDKLYSAASGFKSVAGVVTIVKDTSVTYGNGWYIDAAYALHLTAAVTNPSYGSDETPWKSYKDKIVEVLAEKGSSINCGTYLFSDMPKLEKVDLSRLDTSAVKTYDSMFSDCTKLVSVNLNGIDTHNAENFMGMFIGCLSLEEIDLSALSTENVTNMLAMFASCPSLTKINIESFSADCLYSEFALFGIFSGCTSLSSITVSSDILSLAASQLIEIYPLWRDIENGTSYSTEEELKTIDKTVTLNRGISSSMFYMVMFDMGGHGESPGMYLVGAGGKMKKPEDPTASGYKFGGWYADPYYKTLYDFNKPIIDDTFIFAKWTENIPLVFPEGKGDINGDGKVNAVDTNLMKRIITGVLVPTAAQFDAADINSDGKVNAVDSNLLKRMVLGG